MEKTKMLFKRGRVYWFAYRKDGKLYRVSTRTTSRQEAEHILECHFREKRTPNPSC